MENKYPIAGFAPGHYRNKCIFCEIIFDGDKRAVSCEPCATENSTLVISLKQAKKIALDAMNLGMTLRQNQLNGSDLRSGNEVLREYFENMKLK